MATTSRPFLRSAFSTPGTSPSSMATSPATYAFSSAPANAAQVLSPIRALIFAQVDILAPNRDLVDGAGLLSRVAHDFRDARSVQRRGRGSGRTAGSRRGCR